MSAMLQGPLTSLAYCWTIERVDGAGFAMTSHDREIVVGGIVHSAQPGMVPAAIHKQLGLSESDSEVAGALSSGALDEEELATGRWDGARVRLSVVDWSAPESGAVALMAGELGEVEIGADGFKAALRGAAAKLSRRACPETSPECRAELGDDRCRVDMAGRRMVRTITGLSESGVIVDVAPGLPFVGGRARFLDGANCGLSTSVVGIDGVEVMLRDRMRGAMVIGGRIALSEGCDKMFATCRSRFDNAANFRGEPHLPGNDLLTRYPGN